MECNIRSLVFLVAISDLLVGTGACFSREWIARKEQENKLEYPEMSSNIPNYLLKVLTGQPVDELTDQLNCGLRNKHLEIPSKEIRFQTRFITWLKGISGLSDSEWDKNAQLMQPLQMLDSWIPNVDCQYDCNWKKNSLFIRPLMNLQIKLKETSENVLSNNYTYRSSLPTVPSNISCSNLCPDNIATRLVVQFLPQIMDLVRETMLPFLDNTKDTLYACTEFNTKQECILYYFIEVFEPPPGQYNIESLVKSNATTLDLVANIFNLGFMPSIDENYVQLLIEALKKKSFPLVFLSGVAQSNPDFSPEFDTTYNYNIVNFPEIKNLITSAQLCSYFETYSNGQLNCSQPQSATLGGFKLNDITWKKFLKYLVFYNIFNYVVSNFFTGELQKILYPDPTRVSGPTAVVVGTSNQEFSLSSNSGFSFNYPGVNRNPWLCSLKVSGFGGRHRCAVTLLSVPEEPLTFAGQKRRPTILVSAAHCNYVCSTADNKIVDTCCCRRDATSCSGTPFCGQSPFLRKAEPEELKIVCGEWSLEAIPQNLTPEKETYFTIKEIIHHPRYVAGTRETEDDVYNYGPINGYDISVYIVEDSEVGRDYKFLSPACLPKEDSEYLYPSSGYVAGWADPFPIFRYFDFATLGYYKHTSQRLKEINVQLVECSDISGTYYPFGTRCYRDPSQAACFEYGDSGSPVMHLLKEHEKYSFAGILSASKGCNFVFVDSGGDNPVVFTNVICYLDWIALQYGMKMPASYVKPDSCNLSFGDKNVLNNPDCLSQYGRKCNWPKTIQYVNDNNLTTSPAVEEKCYKYAEIGYEANFYFCIDTEGVLVTCRNDCPGVDPNAIVIGGAAVLATAGVSAVASLGTQALIGALPLGAAVVGGAMAMSFRQCPARQCRVVGGNCCNLVVVGRNIVCPRSC